MKGYVHVYTGDGKGKTTAALGLCLRALGAGLKVFVAQFVKGMKYSELQVLEKLDGLTIHQYGRDCFIHKDPTDEDVACARKGFEEVREALLSGDYDLMVLDEANIAIYYDLFTLDELLALIDERPDHVEVVVTGRKAEQALIDRADLVTEMRLVKHYYDQGVEARPGIES